MIKRSSGIIFICSQRDLIILLSDSCQLCVFLIECPKSCHQQILSRFIFMMNFSETQGRQSSTPSRAYYYPSQRKQGCCCGDKFDVRFDIVKGEQSCCAFCCMFVCRRIFTSNFIPDDKEELERLLPMRQPDFSTPPNKIRYTWIGHSTAVISIGGAVNFLIDPVFARVASPFQWAGPIRYRQPACKIGQLPPIHAVFLSHDHYDHLQRDTINELQRLHKPIFCAGLGSEDCFPQESRVEDFDWTETKKLEINGRVFEVTFVPVAHQGRRWLCDSNSRLWGGFVIKAPEGRKIFYSGDTAYCQVFKEIGDILGPFDLSIISIGAYEPRHVFKHHHVNPQESVKMHKDVKSRKSVGVHWGTFPLGLEDWYSPREDLHAAMKRHELKEDEFVTIDHGASLEIDL